MSQIRLCGADTPVREPLEAKTNPKKVNEVRASIIRAFVMLKAALREIFDESAYERFLLRQRLASSPEAYTKFRRENERYRAQRTKCC